MFDLDPALAAVLALPGDSADVPAMALVGRGDPLALRAVFDADTEAAFAGLPDFEAVTSTSHVVGVADDGEIEMRWYSTAEGQPGPAVVYVHGGGLIGGTLDNYEPRSSTSWTSPVCPSCMSVTVWHPSTVVRRPPRTL